MDFNLKHKRVLVTAGSKGIGRATAQLFLEEGAKVAICSSNFENLQIAKKYLYEKTGREVLTVACDLNKKEDIISAFYEVKKAFNEIDILVNNCGGPPPGFFEDFDEKEWEQGYQQVLLSAVHFTKLVLPEMKKNKWGRIINITSISVKQPIENLLLSNVFRSGLTAMSKTLANQYGKFGITFNNVAPGHTLTSRLEELASVKAEASGKTKEEILEEMSQNVPAKRLGKPEEIAAAVVFLASEQAAYINGITILVDGGEFKGIT